MAKKNLKSILPPFFTAAVVISVVAVLIGTILYYWKQSARHLKKTTTDISYNELSGTGDSELLAPQPLPSHVSMKLPVGAVQQKMLVSNSQVVLGSTIPKTGELGLPGGALSDGLFLVLNRTNTTNGGAWKKYHLALDQRDDSGRVIRATPHCYDLLAKTQIFLSPFGEMVFDKIYTPLLARNAIAAFFPCIGMRSHIAETMPVVWYRPPYRQEIRALLDYILNTLKQTKIALFYEESAWGIEARNAAIDILRNAANLKPCSAVSYQPNTVMVGPAVAAIKRSEPQVIVCLSNGRATYNFVREAINQQLHYVSFLGLSCCERVTRQLQASRGVTMVTSSVVPNPHSSQLPIAQEYRRYMQEYLPNKGLSAESFEGYIAASLFIYFLEQCPPSVTVGELLQHIAQTLAFNFKGLPLRYHHQTLSWSVWLNKGKNVPWDEYREREA